MINYFCGLFKIQRVIQLTIKIIALFSRIFLLFNFKVTLNINIFEFAVKMNILNILN